MRCLTWNCSKASRTSGSVMLGAKGAAVVCAPTLKNARAAAAPPPGGAPYATTSPTLTPNLLKSPSPSRMNSNVCPYVVVTLFSLRALNKKGLLPSCAANVSTMVAPCFPDGRLALFSWPNTTCWFGWTAMEDTALTSLNSTSGVGEAGVPRANSLMVARSASSDRSSRPMACPPGRYMTLAPTNNFANASLCGFKGSSIPIK
mmetsp:Transcript_23059/g.49922  ORF Transcript_23059/g.49922 Transcript_23059/m.49922 type:complete len:203 (+) Transcript_23059:939-1547(+)